MLPDLQPVACDRRLQTRITDLATPTSPISRSSELPSAAVGKSLRSTLMTARSVVGWLRWLCIKFMFTVQHDLDSFCIGVFHDVIVREHISVRADDDARILNLARFRLRIFSVKNKEITEMIQVTVAVAADRFRLRG